MSNGKSQDPANKQFELALEGRKYEIDKFWQRSAFFWVFIAAAFVAIDKTTGFARFGLSCFGLVSSVIWTLQNRGSKYWQEAWEKKVERTEIPILGESFFHRVEQRKKWHFWGAAEWSVSKLAIALSDFTVILWLSFTIYSMGWINASFQMHKNCAYTAALLGTLFYCVLIFLNARKTD